MKEIKVLKCDYAHVEEEKNGILFQNIGNEIEILVNWEILEAVAEIVDIKKMLEDKMMELGWN